MATLPGDGLLIGKLTDYFKRRGDRETASASDALLETRGPGTPWRMAFRDPKNYIVPAALDRAAYVSMLLGQPLLLTGEPGAGKSDFARKLADLFNLGIVQEVHVKTTTLGRDLLYSLDDVARFRDAIDRAQPGQSGQKRVSSRQDSLARKPLSHYVEFNGLGRAILRSAGPDCRVAPVGRDLTEIYAGPVGDGGSIALSELFPREFGAAQGQNPKDRITEPVRSVVLIDEIDKAQRDTPNDLLDAIERMRFDIPELGITVTAQSEYWPIVIITSNAERVLPAPFLRRCVFHRLVTPEDLETLKTILAARLSEDFSRGQLAVDALAIFLNLRKQSQRPPGLSELLAWCLLLQRLGFNESEPLPRDESNLELLEASLSALSKSEVDFDVAKRVLGQWRSGALTRPGGSSP
jgi:MoxR-like ATPase